MKLKLTDDLVMKKINIVTGFIIFFGLVLSSAGMGAQVTGNNVKTVKPEKIQVQQNSIWPRPTILPLPTTTVRIEKTGDISKRNLADQYQCSGRLLGEE